MALTEVAIVAEVEVGDGYDVVLWQQKKRMSYTVEDATQIANELLTAAREAKAKQVADGADRFLRARSALVLADDGTVVA